MGGKRRQEPDAKGVDHARLRRTWDAALGAWMHERGYERRDAEIGRGQRASGAKSEGRRGKHGKRQPDGTRSGASQADLLAAVAALHQKLPRLSKTEVFRRVGRDHGYKSGWSAKQASKGLKWTDPA